MEAREDLKKRGYKFDWSEGYILILKAKKHKLQHIDAIPLIICAYQRFQL